MSEPAVFHVAELDLTFAPQPWPFAVERRAEIDAFFAALQREKPAIWNGRVLIMYAYAVSGGVLRGRYLETDYASFTAWCTWGRPATGAYDCFGAGALVTADNAVLLGVMAPHTFNAGCIYFPCGTPDPSDIVDGKVDLDLSVRRELEEETGIDPAELTVAPGWTTVAIGQYLAQIRTLHSSERAENLRERILAFLAREQRPELADIRIVRGPGDFDPAMPRFLTAFLEHHFRNR